nr:hypothetical protein [Micromonospora sp. DSM 115978]
MGILAGTAVGAVVGAGVGALVGGNIDGLLVVTTSGVAYGMGYGLVASLKHLASPWYAVSKSWFAIRGHLPWQLMRFLEDAHQRGILRQMGGVYKFRHLRLRDHLAVGPD